MRVGILGGTGPAGSGLALRLAASGLDVVVGSRSAERAATKVEEMKRAWPDHALQISPGGNDQAAQADLVVVATPWDGACDLVVSLAGDLEGKVVISMANALVRLNNEFLPLMPPRGSIASHVQASLPRSVVAAAFHHLPAKELANIAEPMVGDVLVCANEESAFTATAELVRKMPNLRPLNAGSLSAAAPVEALTPVLLGLYVRYKTRAGVQFTGIPDDRL
ncbi:MAG: NADPH-dependent F420 reductase [Acidimicrobiia bacterium]